MRAEENRKLQEREREKSEKRGWGESTIKKVL
jgi:hypothetical protein